jgi:hypothetical protein
VTFVGNKATGGTVSQSFTMDGLLGFQTFNLTGFDNITSLTWLNTGSSPNSYHQFDNVQVEGTAVVVSDAAGGNFGTVEAAVPTVSLGDVTEAEGNSDNRTLLVPVTLSAQHVPGDRVLPDRERHRDFDEPHGRAR